MPAVSEIPKNINDFANGFLKSCQRPYSEAYNGYDFTGAGLALVANIIVAVPGGRYLALRRTDINDAHKGVYNNVAGYMQGRGNSDTTIFDTFASELQEEAGIQIDQAVSVRAAGSTVCVEAGDRVLYIVPGLVTFDHIPEVVLNKEHDDSRWVTRSEYMGLPRIPAVDRIFDAMLGGAGEAQRS